MIKTVQLDNYRLLRASGKAPSEFLQGYVSCNMQHINQTSSKLAAICNLQGRVVSSCRVIDYEETPYLLMPSDMLELTVQHLQKYAMLSRVSLEATDTLSVHAILSDTPSGLTMAFPEEVNQCKRSDDVTIIRELGNSASYLIIGEPQNCNDFAKALDPANGTIQDYSLDRIQAGVCTIYPQTSEKFTPHDLNYHELSIIDFKKGCYLGQEIVARMQHRGKLKRHLHYLQTTAEQLAIGDAIHCQDKLVGHIINCERDEAGNYHLLATLLDNADINALQFNRST